MPLPTSPTPSPTAAPPLPPWLAMTEKGLWCEPGRFYVDPHRPVNRAVITHGHGDHARPGHRTVLATPPTLAIMRARYGDAAGHTLQPLAYGEAIRIDGVTVSLHPAGHILGSAQVRIECAGIRVVVSGDFKRCDDPTCPPFEPVACDLFITEATFGLPVFRHPPDAEEIDRLLASLQLFPDRAHLIGVYALGKCQRLIALVRRTGYERPIYLHGALAALCSVYARHGIELGPLLPATGGARRHMAGEIVLCPPSAIADRWSRGFPEPVIGLASGWMLIRQRARQHGVELPLVISDHADWIELTQTLDDVAAPSVLVTHGGEEALVHHARGHGFRAGALSLAGYAEDGE
ncbi:ligase-associated DNA damage response exonuclease [Defluviicoccus vanus]|uniref:Ligase-associated DNA damage response exonuclease n=2 Tax=Defluviicoccus vanus TaxID=111831 RepID=A0A7H1N4V8_9PROT|nr:ligase-associated DNA damage response exonuclease [Defluviicoccus vanus]